MGNLKLLRKRSLLLLIISIFTLGAFCAVYAQESARNSNLENFISNNFANFTAIPTGEYALMSVASQRSDGSANVNTNVHGSLVLKTDGTYEHYIYIGNSPGGCGPGTYSFSGDTLRLMPNASTGCDAKNWKFIYNPQMNRLSLRDDNITLLYCVAGGKDCFKSEE